MRSDAAIRLGRAALPIVAVLSLLLGVGLTLAAAGDTLGFDFLAYHQAAARVLAGQPLYDMSYTETGGFGLFYYPPTFAPLVLAFGLLGATTATWAWIGLSLVAFLVGVAVLPVSRDIRWWIVLLAGWSFPFVYALKLGQVGPILFAAFAIGWRWLDQPTILGLSGAIGAAIKIQPGLILVWALLTRRWRAVVVGGAALLVLAGLSVLLGGFGSWTDFLSLLRTVSDPITTEHNLTPGAVAYRLGVPAGPSAALQALAIVAALGALLASIRWCTAEASYLAAVIVSQLISPILWDHYAMLLLLPVAYLLAAGRWWALAIPLVTAWPLVGVTPNGVYPLVFALTLVAVVWVGRRPAESTAGVAAATDDDRVARHVTRRLDRETLVGLGLVAISALVYWLANRDFDAGRGDFFYLADAFNHGRAWLDVRLGPNDVIVVDGHFYVPFAPFPAVAFMPLVALIGPVTADQLESGINALLAASGVGLCWWYLGRLGVTRRVDRLWLAILFGFSTQILWVTTRGGVWHTGHLVATILTFACLIELRGSRRAWLIGLLAGAAFLTRAPLAFAIPVYAVFLATDGLLDPRRWPWRAWIGLGLGVAPALIAFFAYNQVRFGSLFESGYALATLPPFLEAQRERGLFSIVHIPMNLDYFLVHLPYVVPERDFRPDGLGMSVLITSPGLLLGFRADWRAREVQLLALAALLVLIPTLLYYGGGWLQYGYRYFLDSVPFVIGLCGLAVVHRGLGVGWKAAIAFGVVVMVVGVYWAYLI